jgi:hypothetical protein
MVAWSIGIKLFDQCRMAPENIALVQDALVSHLAGVDGQLFRQEGKA